MNSRLAPRTTRDPRPSRVPIARSEWPEMSGATSGASAARSVDRSTSMYASTGSVRGRPHRVQRAAASLLLQPHHPNVGQFRGELGGDSRGVVDAGVVGDRDARRERELLAQVAVQPAHRVGQCGLLVVHRHHHIEYGHPGGAGRQCGVRLAIRNGFRMPDPASRSRAMSVMTSMVGRAACVRRWAQAMCQL